MSAIAYPLAIEYWNGSGSIDVYDISKQLVATFPSEFLTQGGVNTWQYISSIILFCVREEGSLQSEAGMSAHASGLPLPGRYIYTRTGKPSCVYPSNA